MTSKSFVDWAEENAGFLTPFAAWNARQPEIDALLSALRETLAYAERKTCSHEETRRGGHIWEICDSCGAKWADDEGGKPKFSEPKELKAAAAILAEYSKEKP